MAVKKMMDSRSMQRKESIGLDGEGKEKFESRTIANINKLMTDDDFFKFNELMGSLSAHKTHYLYEKVSNKFIED